MTACATSCKGSTSSQSCWRTAGGPRRRKTPHELAAGEGLSLADRLCLALSQRLGVGVWTADTALGTEGRVRQIR